MYLLLVLTGTGQLELVSCGSAQSQRVLPNDLSHRGQAARRRRRRITNSFLTVIEENSCEKSVSPSSPVQSLPLSLSNSSMLFNECSEIWVLIHLIAAWGIDKSSTVYSFDEKEFRVMCWLFWLVVVFFFHLNRSCFVTWWFISSNLNELSWAYSPPPSESRKEHDFKGQTNRSWIIFPNPTRQRFAGKWVLISHSCRKKLWQSGQRSVWLSDSHALRVQEWSSDIYKAFEWANWEWEEKINWLNRAFEM